MSVSISLQPFCHLLTNEHVLALALIDEHREAASASLGLDTGVVMGPGAFYLLTCGVASLPHVGLARADPDRIVYDPVLDRVRMDPAPSLGCQSFFLNWIQKTVEAVSYLSSIGSSSIELNTLSGLSSDHSLPRCLQHVLDAVLHDAGRAGDLVLRQTVHRPQLQSLPGPGPSRHVEPPRSLKCMVARAQRGSRRGV